MVAGNGLNNVLGMLIPNGTSLRTGTESETDPVRDVLMEALLTVFVDATFLGKTDQGTHTLYQFLYDSIDSTKSDEIGIANHDVETAVWNAIETVTELASLNITDHKDLVISIEGKEVAHPELRTIHINSDDFESGELYPPYMNKETDNATRNTVNFYTTLKPNEAVIVYTLDTHSYFLKPNTHIQTYTTLEIEAEDRSFNIEGEEIVLQRTQSYEEIDVATVTTVTDGRQIGLSLRNTNDIDQLFVFAIGYAYAKIPSEQGPLAVKCEKYQGINVSIFANDTEYTHVEIANGSTDTVKDSINIVRYPSISNSIESGPGLLWYFGSLINSQSELDIPLDKYGHFVKVRNSPLFMIKETDLEEITIPIIMRTTEGEVYRLEVYCWGSGKASYYRKKIGDVSPVPDFDYAGYTQYDTRQNEGDNNIDDIIPGVLELSRTEGPLDNNNASASVSFFRPLNNLTISDEDIMKMVDTLPFREFGSQEYWIPNKTIGPMTLHERYGGTLVLCKVEHEGNIDYYSLRFSYWEVGGQNYGNFAYWRKKLN